MSRGPWKKKPEIKQKQPEGPVDVAFKLEISNEPTEKGLFKVVMVTMQGALVLSRKDVSPADLKRNALQRMKNAAYQYYFLERSPEFDVVPAQPALHV